MFNTHASIESFARSCLTYSLARGYPLKLSTKNTILKKYDGLFMKIFEDIYQAEFKEKWYDFGTVLAKIPAWHKKARNHSYMTDSLG